MFRRPDLPASIRRIGIPFSEQRRLLFTVGTTLLRADKALPQFAFFHESAYQASARLSLEAGYRFYSFLQEEQSHEDGNRIHLRTHGPVVHAALRY